MIRESPSAAFLTVLDHLGIPPDQLLLATATDSSILGDPCRVWLAITPAELLIWREPEKNEAAPAPPRRFNIANCTGFRALGVVGSGFLQAEIDHVWIDLLRYSNSLADRFGRLAVKLEKLRHTGEFTITPDEEIDRRRCRTCGMTLRFIDDVCLNCIDRRAVAARVWDMLRPYRRSVAFMSALVLLGVGLELVPPKLQQYLVDHVLRPGGGGGSARELLSVLAVLVLSLAAARLITAIINTFKGRLTHRVGTAMTFDLRARVVEKLLALPAAFHDRYQVGVLINRATQDSEAIHGLIQHLTSGFLLQVLQLIAVGIMLFVLNPRLAAYTLIPAPFVLIGSWLFWRKNYPQHYRHWDSASKQAGLLGGMLSGIRVVKAFAQESREAQRFAKSSTYLRDSRRSVEFTTNTFSVITQFIFGLGGLIVWYEGGENVLGQSMTLGSLMAFLAYLALFYAPLATLAQLATWLTSFTTACHRIFELLDTPLQIADPAQPRALPHPEGRITFDHVTFGYDRHYPVLKDLSFEIRPREMIGVVGRSGSGKTTLVNLICRFYDTDDGSVSIDGTDVRSLARADLRRHVGIVLQDPFLFRGTIWENLTYGKPDASTEAVLTAAKAASAHDFIMRMPFAYEMPVGERGAGLSGGERQRISLARALLYDPAILILDEATSSVDTESEKAIQDALRVLTKNRTTIAIAHRLFTLRNADRILVFDQGRLIEEGSHETLLAQDGTYARLVKLQTRLAAGTADGASELTKLADAATPAPGASAASAAAAAAAAASSPSALKQSASDIQHLPLTSHREIKCPTPDIPLPTSDIPHLPGTSQPPGCDVTGHTSHILHPTSDIPPFQPRWLTPETARIHLGNHDALHVTIESDRIYGGVFALRAFPSQRPNEYICLLHHDSAGADHEIGMIRSLSDFPPQAQHLLRQALQRRYMLHEVTGVDDAELRYGFLIMRLRTTRGPVRFMMRWTQSQALDYGQSGKILTDVQENRYLVPDVNALPRKDREVFRRYIYW